METGLYYVFIVCTFFIDIAIPTQPMNKLRLVEAILVKISCSSYPLRGPGSWYSGRTFGPDFSWIVCRPRVWTSCTILLGGRAGIRDWVQVLMVTVMFWRILLEFSGHPRRMGANEPRCSGSKMGSRSLNGESPSNKIIMANPQEATSPQQGTRLLCFLTFPKWMTSDPTGIFPENAEWILTWEMTSIRIICTVKFM